MSKPAVRGEGVRAVGDALREAYTQGWLAGWEEGHRMTVLNGQQAYCPRARHVSENEWPHDPIATAIRQIATGIAAAMAPTPNSE